MWSSGLCEQRENKEHEYDKHGESDPEADHDGVWKEDNIIIVQSLTDETRPSYTPITSLSCPLLVRLNLLTMQLKCAFTISKMWLLSDMFALFINI